MSFIKSVVVIIVLIHVAHYMDTTIATHNSYVTHVVHTGRSPAVLEGAVVFNGTRSPAIVSNND